ncbi:EG45-like domain containing protein [Pyrus x bretschneideri]|uniref:EG45-like domain containing protein n=1 Tax=Pyrus x bretschneideri TaxID=225117 RepID=UPI00202EFEA2|nr:EG45-like domain containing protein [Pyrus x bretschneideri]
MHIFSNFVVNMMRLLFVSIVLSLLCRELRLVYGDISTATFYDPPYIPTKCFGSRQDQFPPGNLFAAVSEGLWDNGAACGRRYRLRCLSGRNQPCKGGATVDVTVVDLWRDSTGPSTVAMSTDAFAVISHSPSTRINVEYVQI